MLNLNISTWLAFTLKETLLLFKLLSTEPFVVVKWLAELAHDHEVLSSIPATSKLALLKWVQYQHSRKKNRGKNWYHSLNFTALEKSKVFCNQCRLCWRQQEIFPNLGLQSSYHTAYDYFKYCITVKGCPSLTQWNSLNRPRRMGCDGHVFPL